MKLISTCFKCMEEASTGATPFIPQLVTLVPQHTGLYRFVCSKGHESVAILQERHFQLLFEIGLHALIAGYPREAVADFTASLERFYEFYSRFIFRLNGLDDAVVADLWKNVASQSERQFGLYLSAYALQEKAAAPALDSKRAEFRNNVIHKGHIPTYDDALSYGRSVQELIQPVLTDLATRYAEDLHEDTFRHLREQNPKHEHAATIFNNTTLSFNFGAPTSSIEEKLHFLRQLPWS